MSNRLVKYWTVVAIALTFLLPASSMGQRNLIIKIKNPKSTFRVTASADRTPPIYKGGESFKLTLRTTADAFVYAFNCTEDGEVYCLFPNQIQTENYIKANSVVTIPPEKAEYEIGVVAPFGSEYVKVIASKKKLNSLDLQTLQKAVATQIKSPGAIKLLQELRKKDSHEWAEDAVLIQTVAAEKKGRTKPKNESMAERKQKRHRPKLIALHIGLSYYEDRGGFRNSACARDAQAMAKVMRDKAGFQVQTMLNKDATRSRIIAALQALETTTAPGDIIAIHWSGSIHYQQTSGRQVDALVPFDAEMTTVTGRTRSLITENDLAEILGRLKGRQIICLFETYRYCESRFGSRSINGIFDNLVKSLAEVRGGQPNLVLIESCQKSQKPYVHKESHLSVMTHYFANTLNKTADTATVGQLYQQIADQVETYVRGTYKESQRPSLSYHGSLHFSLVR
ncbi:MAG: DUF4384 domain-containing protein [Gemmataceae bacterium]